MITIKTLGSSSAGNCYRLSSGGRSLLLECGLPWKKIKEGLNFETSDLDGCLVSHHHHDHSRAAGDLMKAGIDIYATKEAFSEMGVKSHSHRFVPIVQNRIFRIGGFWRVIPFNTQHDAPGSVGFVISNQSSADIVLFMTDTAYCRYNFPDRFTVIMIEANFSESILQYNVDKGMIDAARAKRVRENHFSIERVVDLLRANDLSKLREVRLLHLSSGNSDEAMFKRMIQEVTGVPVIVEDESLYNVIGFSR